MKHTPGPWKLIVDDKAYFGDELKIVTDNRHIATVNPATNEGPANAQLIASAPDLLEELTWLKELNREMAGMLEDVLYYELPSDVYATIKEVLAKAEGEG